MSRTAHVVYALIERPPNVPQSAWISPTVRDIQRRLLERAGLTLTSRHITRLLQELEQFGLIKKEDRSGQPRPRSPQERAARYEIANPDRLTEGEISLLLSRKMTASHEERRRKRKEVNALLIAKGKALTDTLIKEHKQAGE
ncbi:hypothetical protein ES703_50087 [subsurface metagenome]